MKREDAPDTKRARRVVLLLLAIILLSAGDLLATSAHLRSTGMVELNPIARAIVEWTQSVWGLALYKGVTVAVCVAVLYRVRTSRQAELGAWLGVAILALLAFHWGAYTRHSASPDVIATQGNGLVLEKWLSLAE